MAFYEEISTYYDYIFPVNETQLNFFQKHFSTNEVKSVLDIACGSGNYTIAFASWGINAIGVDLEEDMVQKAREKAKGNKNISFLTGDMRSLPFEEGDFDSAICIGNSLPHILKDDDLATALKEMHRILSKKGSLILQTVNYDRILKNQITELPLIENREVNLVFRRLYGFREDGLIDFNTILEVQKDEGVKNFKNTVILRPLTKAELTERLRHAGFSEVTVYGAFDGREHNEDSPATIVVARK